MERKKALSKIARRRVWTLHGFGGAFLFPRIRGRAVEKKEKEAKRKKIQNYY